MSFIPEMTSLSQINRASRHWLAKQESVNHSTDNSKGECSSRASQSQTGVKLFHGLRQVVSTSWRRVDTAIFNERRKAPRWWLGSPRPCRSASKKRGGCAPSLFGVFCRLELKARLRYLLTLHMRVAIPLLVSLFTVGIHLCAAPGEK